MKRLIIAFLLLAITLMLPTRTQAAEFWQIDLFNSDIQLESSGKILVTETIDTDFAYQNKHGIYRDLPINYTTQSGNKLYSQVDILSVTQDSKKAEVEKSRNGDNLRLRIGDPDRTLNGKHSYVIRYEVSGVLSSYNDYDELYWNVTGNGWTVPIAKATATLHLPSDKDGSFLQASCYQGPERSTDTCQQSIDSKTATFSTTHSLNEGEGLTVAASYPKGLLPILKVSPPPSPFTGHFFSLLGLGFILTSLPGITTVFRKWWQQGRDAQHPNDPSPTNEPIKQTIVPEYESPSGLRPAEIGTLIDEKADTTDITATIVDLAVRGYLTITEEPKKWFSSADYTLAKKKDPDSKLLGYEKALLDKLFDKRDSVRTSELTNTFYQDLAIIKNEVYDEVTSKQLFVRNPQTVRNTWLGIGAFILIVGVGGSIGSAISIETLASIAGLLLGISAGLVVTGFTTLISAFAMPARTAHGRELYRQAKGYELFINTAEKYRARFAEKENLFNEILPYAIVFGATKKLADAMKNMGINPPAPTWYYGPHPFNPVFFANSVTSFDKSLSTAMASAPGSSGSGGGGFSGGGFGGGGGGGW